MQVNHRPAQGPYSVALLVYVRGWPTPTPHREWKGKETKGKRDEEGGVSWRLSCWLDSISEMGE